MVQRLRDLGRRVWLLPLALAVPMVVALVSEGRPRWYPAGDFAQAELHVRAVPAHMPLVGAAARVGTIIDQGSHPGPAGAVVLAVPYRLLGSQSWSLLAATAVLHLVAFTAFFVVLRRVGGLRAVAIAAVVAAVLVRGAGAGWFLEPWNPWFGIVVLALALACVWALWEGHVSLLPLHVLACSFCVQVHLGYGVVAGGLLLAGVVAALRQRPLARRALATSAGVLALAWLPAVIDEVTREPGNITRLWRHFTNPPDSLAGTRAALTAFANEFNLFGTWLLQRDRQPTDGLDAVAIVGLLAMLALVAAAAFVARRSADRRALRALGVAGLAVVLSVVTLTRIFGPVYDYIIRWMTTVTTFTVIVCLWVLWRHRPTRDTTVLAVGAVIAAVSLGAATVGATDALPPLDTDSSVTAELSRQLVPELTDDQRYMVRVHDPVSLGAPAIGVVLELERQGFDVGVESWLSANVMPHRTRSLEEVDTVLYVVTGETSISDTLALDGAVELARTDPRSPAEVAESDSLRAGIEAGLAAAGRDDLVVRLDEQYGVSQVESEGGLPDELLTSLAAYRDLRLPAAVIAVPVGSVS